MSKTWKRIISTLAFAGIFTAAQTSPAFASDDAASYPDKRILIVTPTAAGSPFDLLTRIYADRLRQKVGVPVVVENATGGQGLIATNRVLNAASDGYTFLLTSTGLATAPHIFEDVGYTLDDFEPVAALGQAPYIIFASSSVPADDIPSLLEYLKNNGKDVNHGVLTVSQLSTLLARKLGAAAGGAPITEVGYRGSGDMIRALMTDDIQLIATTYSVGGPHLSSGKVKAIGTLAEVRTKQLPDLPTFKELGYSDVYSNIWAGMFVKSDVPQGIIEKIKSVSAEIIDDPEYVKAMDPTGMEPWSITVDEMPAALKAEADLFASDIKKYNLTLPR